MRSVKYTVFLFLLLSNALNAFKIMSVNVLGGFPYSKFNQSGYVVAPATRDRAFLQLIRQERPDIICLQEFDTHEWTAPQGYALQPGAGRSYLAVMYNPTLLRVINHQSFAPENIMLVTFADKITGAVFSIINIHALSGQSQANIGCFNAAIAAAGNTPIVAVGDWNTGSQVNAQVLLGNIFTAANGFTEDSAGIIATARNVNRDTAEKLDYIFTKGVASVNAVRAVPDVSGSSGLALLLPHASLLQNKFDPLNASNHFSDHAALFAEVRVAGAAVQAPQVNQGVPAFAMQPQQPGALLQQSAPVLLPVGYRHAYSSSGVNYTHEKGYQGDVVWSPEGFLELLSSHGKITRVAPSRNNQDEVYSINTANRGPDYGYKASLGVADYAQPQQAAVAHLPMHQVTQAFGGQAHHAGLGVNQSQQSLPVQSSLPLGYRYAYSSPGVRYAHEKGYAGDVCWDTQGFLVFVTPKGVISKAVPSPKNPSAVYLLDPTGHHPSYGYKVQSGLKRY